MLSTGTGTQEVLREHQYSHYHPCYLLRGLSTDAGDKPWRVVGSSSGRGGLRGRHHIQHSHASDGSGQAPASAAPCGPHIKLPPAPSRRAHSACHALVHIRTPAEHALPASLLHLPSPSRGHLLQEVFLDTLPHPALPSLLESVPYISAHEGHFLLDFLGIS